MTQTGSWPSPPPWCEHGPGGHGAAAEEPGEIAATAPANARAWLLIEFDGRWAREATASALPAPLAKLAIGADETGIRVQLIRRPVRTRRTRGVRRDGDLGTGGSPAVFAAWTAAPAPRLWRFDPAGLDPAGLDPAGLGPRTLAALAAGQLDGMPPEPGPLFLVCTHGSRDRCCARFGVPLARELATRYPDEVWETTHVGGHRFAATLVILPHGLYYGPVDTAAAHGAIDAYRRGEIAARGYRGRAGQDTTVQQAECAAAARWGTLGLRPAPASPSAARRS